MEAILLLILIINIILFSLGFYGYPDNPTKSKISIFLFLIGVSIFLMPNKVLYYYGIIIFIFSIIYRHIFVESDYNNDYQATPFMNYITRGGELNNNLFFAGIFLLIINVLSINLYFNKYRGDVDTVLILVSAYWILYRNIPKYYYMERDFTFVFLNLLAVLLAFPIIFSTLVSGYSNEYSSGDLVNVFLVKPLANMLTILGYDVNFYYDRLSFIDLSSGETMTVWIAKSCSGIYSVIVFLSAYFSYLINSTSGFNFNTFFLMIIGIVLAYFANLVRMAIIILAGHYWGPEALFWTHENVGWLIFTIWIMIFWTFLNKFDLIDTRRM